MSNVTDEQLQPEVPLQGFTYQDRAALLPELGASIDAAGGWVLDRRSLSSSAMEMFLEVQQHSLPEVYGAILSSGLELTRESHRVLAERCNCNLHLPHRKGVASILTLRVELHFLHDVPQRTDLSRLVTMAAANA